MAEGGGEAKVRVVRCPNCQNLLPEVANMSVYRCGGCGATLLAKGSAPGSEASPKKPDRVKAKYLEVSETSAEKKEEVSDASFETDCEGNRAESRRQEDLVPKKAETSLGISVSKSEDNISPKKDNSVRVDDPPKESETQFRGGNCQREPLLPVHDLNKYGKALVKTDLQEGGVSKQSADKSFYPEQAQVQKGEENENPRAFMKGVWPDPYPDEGPSDNHQNLRLADGDHSKRQNVGGASKVAYLEQDQEELLRMLDQLRDQVQKTCEVSDKQKMSAMVDRMKASFSSYTHHVHANRFPDGSSTLNRNPSRRSATVQQQNVGLLDFNSNIPSLNDMPRYGDHFARRRAPIHQAGECPQRLADKCVNGQFDPDPIVTYNQEPLYHQPACSCVRCYRRQFSVPARGLATTFGHQKVPYVANNHGLLPVDIPSVLGSRSYNSRFRNVPFYSHEPRPYHRTMFRRNAGHSCQAFAGAAPFTICCSCFELLKLPDKSLLLKKKKFKLRCGACFKVISVQRDGSRLVTSAAAPALPVSSKDNDIAGNSPGDCIQSTDEKLVLPCIVTSSDHEMIERTHGFKSLTGLEKVKGLSSSSTMSEHIDSPDGRISQKGVPTSADCSLDPQDISRVSSLPIHEHLGFSLSGPAIDGSGSGSFSKRSKQEKNTFLSGNFKQNSVKDVIVATEMDLLVNEFPNANSSQEYLDIISKNDVQPRIAKAGDAFLSGLKKSFRFNKSMGHGRSKVSVNGHPIPDRFVKKAEKQAGPVYPGDYWYDYRAGFWGVMGHPCHGIIPPSIEEFNYPMPNNCAGGNTGVLVNGRELHQKDLDLLVARGLPSNAGSYIVEISGRVWDESSSEELDSLGKLAPTVERMKHGFGMRVPRSLRSNC